MNNFKTCINKFVDLRKLVLRIWFILWAILIILLIMKYLFNIWYPITVNNKMLNNLFVFLDSHNIIKTLIYYILYLFSSNILLLTCIKKKKYNKLYQPVIFNLLFLFIVVLKTKFNFLGLVCEISLVIFSIIYNLKTKTYHKNILNILMPIGIYLIVNIWQFNIYLIRDFNLEILQQLPSMYSIILMLDYYIFLIITWIGVSYMGILSWGWLFQKEVTELEALKAEELKKEEPDKELLEQIEKAIKQKEEK